MKTWQAPGIYFFLSYAHSTPTSTGIGADDIDPSVKDFYRDLSAEVRRLARPSAPPEVGFFDDLLPAGSDWHAGLTAALGAAEVFVPLYSPGYLSRPWPQRERESFRRRVAALVPDEEWRRHVIPVLWIPFPPEDRLPDVDEALVIGRGIPGYAENGLRALSVLTSYREQYLQIRDRLAHRIVEVAERSQLGPSSAPDPDEVTTAPTPLSETPFVVAVCAPTKSVLWKPFAQAEVPIAEYAATVAERLGLAARIVDLGVERSILDTCPAVLLIDPWILQRKNGRSLLRAGVKGLPKWVIPLVVLDKNDPEYAERGLGLGREVTDILSPSGVPRVRQAREVEEFVHLMPSLVTEARRQYLRNAPVFPPKGQHPGRPRLGGHDLSAFRQARD